MLSRNHQIYIAVGILFIIFILNGCSTEKNTLVTRSFHNITSNYNIFFNGFESFNRGVKKAEESFLDDYTRILPIFTYGDETAAQNIGPDMDRSIKKATKVITLHSITVKPEFKNGPQSPKQKEFYAKKEYNKFVPDNYLLMGKAYLYSHEFSLAEETFKFILSEYPDEDVALETLVWLARVYNETEEFIEAESVLNLLTINEEIPKKLIADLYATQADYYLKQEKYENTIEPLTRAFENTSKKTYRVRYAFILGQLHQEAGDPEKASEYYEKVIKMNPAYEMSFTARVNRASVYVAGSGSLKDITSELMKMLKDEKNAEYQDQIYYALGNIYQREGDMNEAIRNYKLSSETSIINVKQKTTSCLRLADIYYDRLEYQLASAYYDSASANLTSSYPGYADIMVKSGSLTKLVESLVIIQFEDSVQQLAAMEEADRLALIDTLIARLVEEERIAKEMESMAAQDQQFNRMMLNQSTTRQGGGFTSGSTQSGKWYFYNQAAKSFGQPEFRMKWGTRKLEDNWRRKNKSAISFGEQEDLESDSTAQEITERKILDNKTREFYLQDIPLTDSMMEKSHERLLTALYNSGVVYKNELKDYNASNEQFETLLADYPGNENTLPSYYNLYTNFNELDNQPKSQLYKSAIIREFPDSEIAQYMTNPEFIKELEARENAENVFFESVYRKYQNEQYTEVIADVDTALIRFPESELIPRYKFLKIMSIGATDDIMTFSLALDSFGKTYPREEIGRRAQIILAHVKEFDPEVKVETQKIEAEEIYQYDTASVHYFGMIINGIIDVNQLKFEIINFNLDFYPETDFEVVSERIDREDHLILVKSFELKEDAWMYQDSINMAQSIFDLIGETSHQRFIISDLNAQTLISDGISAKYMLFYDKHYFAEQQKEGATAEPGIEDGN